MTDKGEMVAHVAEATVLQLQGHDLNPGPSVSNTVL